MKILTINVVGIPGGSSSDLIEANVFQDYDAVVVNPSSLDSLYNCVRNKIWLDRNNQVLEDKKGLLLQSWNTKRRQQIYGLLTNGGVVVCFMCPVSYNSFTYENPNEVSDKHYVTNFGWLFEKKDLEMFDISYDKGQTIDYIDFSHPLSAYLKNKPSWEAYISQDSCPSWRILASAWGTHVVSLTKKIGKGHIVLLPSSYHYQNGELVERCIKELLGDKEPSQIPSWTTPILVPGQQEVLSELGGVEAKIEELGKERSKLVAKNEDLERWKWLLYETGKHRLEPVVRDAL